MKLVTLEAAFAPEKIEDAVAAVEAQADVVRAMDGCQSYAVYQSPGALAIVQQWQDMDRFDAYRQSSAFATLGAALKPLMSAPPVTTVASVDSN